MANSTAAGVISSDTSDPMAASIGAAAIDWQPPIHFWFTSSRGTKLHNFIVLPPNFDGEAARALA